MTQIIIVVHFSISHYENTGTPDEPIWIYCATGYLRFHIQADIETVMHRFDKLEESISKKVTEKTAELISPHQDEYNKFELNSYEIFEANLEDEQIDEYEIL